MSYRICVLLPTYNHYKSLFSIVSHLRSIGLDILIVDDGSQKPTRDIIEKICVAMPEVNYIRLTENQGKGAAVSIGLKHLYDLGYTHAFQIDADGQHSLENIEDFIKVSHCNPQILLSGKPVYDKSIPFARKIGRWFTHIWVWIETLSFQISDSMCGFRIYPIKETLAILDKISIGTRMDFDTEIMVRLFWEKTPVVMIPIRVFYPKGNTSNFRVVQDNWRITKMHTRLFFTMLAHLPKVIKNHPNYNVLNLPSHLTCWSTIEERGTLVGLFFLSLILKIFGQRICKWIGVPIVFYFYLTGKQQRLASQKFLEKVYIAGGLPKKPKFWQFFSHFLSFFEITVDKFAGWVGSFRKDTINKDSLKVLEATLNSQKGGVLLVSHLGNIDLCRAIASTDRRNRLHILLHTKKSKIFSRIIHLFNPDFKLNIIEVTEMGAESIVYLQEKIDNGDWVVIAADRFPIQNNKHISYVPFLKEKAPFAQGPYILSSLLGCPVYTVIAVRESGQYYIFVEKFSQKIILHRASRERDLDKYATRYAQYLENYAMKYPYQWFNFFDFWKKI